jgi:EAL domain-containing protein (putative c-di-GMP-specific phosphodiesterase class I)
MFGGNLVSMKVEQAELLLRMRDADGSDKLLAPGAFLPAAERFDQIGLIDEWVLDRAVELAAAGHRVEVNLSAKTISDPRQIDRIEQVVIQSGAAPQNLIFEITETAAAENLEAARAFAVRLRQLGCAFALDVHVSAASAGGLPQDRSRVRQGTAARGQQPRCRPGDHRGR